MTARRLVALLAACALGAAASAARADVTLANAWMRPAAAGQKEAQVYVDIRANEPLKLVAAKSPIAKGAELVLLDPPQPDTGTLRVVREIAVAPNQETRLAYPGSHVRLVDLTRAASPSEQVPIELTFVDAAGKQRVVRTEALVRGLVARRPDGSEAPHPPVAK